MNSLKEKNTENKTRKNNYYLKNKSLNNKSSNNKSKNFTEKVLNDTTNYRNDFTLEYTTKEPVDSPNNSKKEINDGENTTQKSTNVTRDIQEPDMDMEYSTCSSYDCTGLIPAIAGSDEEVENYQELYPFLPTGVTPDKK